MMGHKSKLSGAWEWDILTKWRRWHSPAPGIVAYTKRRHNKRLRKQAKEKLEHETRS